MNRSESQNPTTDGGLSINEQEREVLAEEIAAFAASLPGSESRGHYARLLDEIEGGQVESHLLPALQKALEISLQTGRARRIYGPQGEQQLLQVFRRTPRGGAIREAIEETNQALTALQGQSIQELRFSLLRPGVYQLGIETDRAEVVLEIDEQGVWAKNIAVGA
jgi:hypothetical protein